MSTSRQRQFEAFFGHQINESSSDDTIATNNATPLFSPPTTLRPRTVSFPSPRRVDGVSTVMMGRSPATAASMRSRTRPSEVFYSPLSQVSSIHSASPVTLSTMNIKPAGTMQMERFKEANIVKCQSPRELQQIILDLKTHGHYPFLVRTAERRLYSLQTASVCPLIEEEENDADSKVAMTPKNTTMSLVYSFDEEQEPDPLSLSPPPLAVPQSARRISPASVSREKELEQQVEQLSQKIVELNQTLRQEKRDFERQLNTIQQAKQASQQHALNLQSSLDDSHQTAEEMSKQLADLQAVKQSLSRQIQLEISARLAFEKQAQSVEASLQQKVQELMDHIAFLQDSDGKQHELNQLLKSAQANFEAVKKERNGILEILVQAAGRDVSAVPKMTQSERGAVVKDYIKQSKDQTEKSKSAVQAMQEALVVSETERRNISSTLKSTSDRLQAALSKQQELEQENRQLSSKVQSLTEELKESREEATRLLNQVREDNEKQWLKREAMFKNTIRKLQKELRAEKKKTTSSDDSVENAPINQVTSSRNKASDSSSLRVRGTVIRPVLQDNVNVMNRSNPPTNATGNAEVRKPNRFLDKPGIKLQKIENRLGRAATKPAPEVLQPKCMFRSATTYKPIEKMMLKTTQDSRTEIPTDEAQRAPSVVVRPIDAFKGKTPSKNRADFVRGNGGIKGLQEKLRQVRSPIFNAGNRF